MLPVELRRSPIVILGFGREGQSTWRFFEREIPEARVSIADRTPLHALPPEVSALLSPLPRSALFFGENYLRALENAEVIVKSPGIPTHLVELQAARKRGARITSHTEIFFRCRTGRVIGVTGTKGKSTTASLIAHLLHEAGRDVRLVGNIGSPALDALTEPASRDRWFVYELSSFQLEGLTQSPDVAVFLNFFAEHLDHHGGLSGYLAAKSNITLHQQPGDYFIYNAALDTLNTLASQSRATPVPFALVDVPVLHEPGHPASCVRNGQLLYRNGTVTEIVARVREVPLLGEFNLNNALAAVAAAKLVGLSAAQISAALTTFRPLPHRLEEIGTFRGISFYSAPLATIPEATMAHIETLGPRVHTLLAGGHDRHIDYTTFGRFLAAKQISCLILFPTTGVRILESVLAALPPGSPPPTIRHVERMEDAVRAAYELTPPGKICLHSPASASYSVFRNFQDRGEQFMRSVKALGVD